MYKFIFSILFSFLFLSVSFAQNNNDLHVGQTVWAIGGFEGVVHSILPNSEVMVTIDKYNFMLHRADLAIQGCYGKNACSLNRVWTSSGDAGLIMGIFPNGEVMIRVSDFNDKYSQNNLAVAGCFKRLCTRDIVMVITDTGHYGTVNGFFTDGQVSVEIYGKNYKFNYNDLIH